MGQTSFKNKYEQNEECVKIIPKNPSADLLLYSYKSNTNALAILTS
jgi:hypothetical protein